MTARNPETGLPFSRIVRAARALAALFPPNLFAWVEWIQDAIDSMAPEDGLYLMIAAGNCALVTAYEIESSIADGYRTWGRVR